MYGRGRYYLDNVRIEDGELMIDCTRTDADHFGVRTIKMGPKEAQSLVDEIWRTAEDYQNEIRWRLANG